MSEANCLETQAHILVVVPTLTGSRMLSLPLQSCHPFLSAVAAAVSYSPSDSDQLGAAVWKQTAGHGWDMDSLSHHQHTADYSPARWVRPLTSRSSTGSASVTMSASLWASEVRLLGLGR